MTTQINLNELATLTHKELVALYTELTGQTKWFPNKAAVIAAITAIREAMAEAEKAAEEAADRAEQEATATVIHLIHEDARVTITGELANRQFRATKPGKKTFTRNVLQTNDETAQWVELLGAYWLVEPRGDGRWEVIAKIGDSKDSVID